MSETGKRESTEQTENVRDRPAERERKGEREWERHTRREGDRDGWGETACIASYHNKVKELFMREENTV